MFHTDPEDKDGLELLTKIFIIIPPLSLVTGIPGILLAIHSNLPFFRHFNTGHFGVSLLATIVLAYMYTVDWIVVGTMCNIILIGTNGVSFCLKKITEARFVSYALLSVTCM